MSSSGQLVSQGQHASDPELKGPIFHLMVPTSVWNSDCGVFKVWISKEMVWKYFCVSRLLQQGGLLCMLKKSVGLH